MPLVEAETPEPNPVRRAYEFWTGGTDQPGWDQTMMLCAVRPDEYNKWQDDVNGKHLCLIQKMPVQQLEKEIEDIML